MTTKSKELVKKETATTNPAERFISAVMKEFPNGVNGQPIELTSFQKKLIQNYFIKLDGVLKEGEIKRMAKSEQYRDALALTWQNINIHKLAQDVVAFSSIGLDPLQKNHINLIPFKNNKTNQYDIVPIEGYNGLELKAVKYGHDVPDDVIFELKYSTDKFKSYKKNFENKIESYNFEITDDFNRGELEGGFYYMIYDDNHEKNQLVVLNRSKIEKRKPKYASAEFWGGEKDNWENGKKKGKIQVEGWEEEMFLKTLKRHCWNSINIDSQKIDDHLLRVLQSEQQSNDLEVQIQIEKGSNKKEIGFNDVEDAQEVIEINAKEEPKNEEPTPKEKQTEMPSF